MTFAVVLHGSVSVWQAVIVGVIFAGVLLASWELEDMNRLLGQAVRKALIDADIPTKEAVAVMGIDRSQFNKALLGEGYRLLALNHLVKLGPVFMGHLTRHLMWLTAQQRYLDLIEAVRVKEQA